jgi:hypothetical protein
MASSPLWKHALSTNVGHFVHELRWRDLLFTNVQLNFNMQLQTQSNWCWAATATSVSLFYRPSSSWTQCSVASAELSQSCCVSPVPGPCNVPWYLDRALTRTENFVSMSGAAPFSTVEAELKGGRVVGARVGWSGGGGHFMAIYGCGTRAGDQYFDIDDPIYGKSSPTVATFSSSYQGSGTWTHTYLTRAPRVRIKFPPFQLEDRILKRIWELRPIIADPRLVRDPQLGAGSDAQDVQLSLPHEIETLGLADLVEGGGRSKSGEGGAERSGTVRVVQLEGGRPTAFLDLSTGDNPNVVQIGREDNSYLRLLEQGLDAITHYDGEGGGGEVSELRLLRIPALHVEALVVREDESGNEYAVVIRSMQPNVDLFRPMPVEELVDRLREPARVILADDDPLKGS